MLLRPDPAAHFASPHAIAPLRLPFPGCLARAAGEDLETSRLSPQPRPGADETARNWIIYSLPTKPPDELALNLQCLQDCAQSDPMFRKDLQRLEKLKASCCEPAEVFAK